MKYTYSISLILLSSYQLCFSSTLSVGNATYTVPEDWTIDYASPTTALISDLTESSVAIWLPRRIFVIGTGYPFTKYPFFDIPGLTESPNIAGGFAPDVSGIIDGSIHNNPSDILNKVDGDVAELLTDYNDYARDQALANEADTYIITSLSPVSFTLLPGGAYERIYSLTEVFTGSQEMLGNQGVGYLGLIIDADSISYYAEIHAMPIFNPLTTEETSTLYNISDSYTTSNPLTIADSDLLTFTLNGDGTEYSVSDCNQNASDSLVIPSSHNDLPVTSIGNEAFNGCSSLISITIPDSVTLIGNNAFDSCSGLTSITFEGPPPALDINTLTDSGSTPIIYYKAFPQMYSVYKETYNLPMVYLGPPTINLQPQGVISSIGEAVSLSVLATDFESSQLSYQWMRNGVDIAEETTATLSIASIASTDSGSYQVKVSNAAGTTTSEAASVTLLASNLYTQQQFDTAFSTGFAFGVTTVQENAANYGLVADKNIEDGRAGSSSIQVTNGTATLQLQIERSDDLNNWTSHQDDLISIPIQLNADSQFFRFKMGEEDTFSTFN